MKVISTNDAPKAVGAYSQAILVDKFIYISGQLPINPENDKIPTNIKQQTKQSLLNIYNILRKCNSNFDNIIKTTIYLTDLSNFKIVNEIYESFFTNEVYPARSCFEVSKLPKNADIEIEVIAKIKED